MVGGRLKRWAGEVRVDRILADAALTGGGGVLGYEPGLDLGREGSGSSIFESCEGFEVQFIGVESLEEVLGVVSEVVKVEVSHVGRLVWGGVKVEGADGSSEARVPRPEALTLRPPLLRRGEGE